MKHVLTRNLPVLALSSLLTACAGNPWLSAGKRQLDEGNADAALIYLQQAVRDYPDDREARSFYLRQRDGALGRILADAAAARAGGNPDAAEDGYRQALRIDPNNPRAKEGLAQLAAAQRHAVALREAEAVLKNGDLAGAEKRLRAILAQAPGNADARTALTRLQQQAPAAEAQAQALKGPLAQPITLEFREAPLKSVFEVIARTSGINFAFDKDIKADAKTTVFVRNTSIDEVIRLILATNQLARKMLNENSVLIYPNQPAKLKDYQELEVRSFFLANADVKQAMALIKGIVKSRDVFIDEKLNLLVVRDTPEALILAERLLESLDLAEPEVMLEVEVMEVARSRLTELGLRFPDAVGYGLLSGSGNTTTVFDAAGNLVTTTPQTGSSVAPGVVNLHNRSGLTSFVANPALTLNLRNEDGDSNLLANPRIRVKNHEKAKIHIGDKLPVFTTTSTANVGVSASVTYLDVGLKLDVEPTVYLQDEVGIKVGLEVSSVVKEIPGPSSSLAYQVGTRSAATTLRLKDGETQVLAGLINDEERSSANKLPGLGDIPLLGRLFSNQRNGHNKTEIVLLITPRVVRNLAQPASAASNTPSGTDSAVGAPPLRLSNTPPGSFGMTGADGAVTPEAPKRLLRRAVPAGAALPTESPAPETPSPAVPAPEAAAPEPTAEPAPAAQ